MLGQSYAYTPRTPIAGVRVQPDSGAGSRGSGKDRSAGLFRRWWALTTDEGYLTSGASRRDFWKVLLPLPGLLAIAVDRGDNNLLMVDACAAVVLLAAAFLPMVSLGSDMVVALLLTLQVAAHGLLAEEAEVYFRHLQVLIIFSMASAGIHTLGLAGFLTASTAALYLLCPTALDVEEVLACMYVLFLSASAERRIAQLVSERHGYKALNLASSHHDGYLDFSTGRPLQMDAFSRVASLDPVYSSRASAEPLNSSPRGALSDNEDLSGRLPRSDEESERASSLADYVLSRLSPSDMSARSTMADYVFSRLTPGQGQPARSRTRPRQRFAAAQVQMPGAATHQAPCFSREPEDKAKDKAETPSIPQQEAPAYGGAHLGSVAAAAVASAAVASPHHAPSTTSPTSQQSGSPKQQAPETPSQSGPISPLAGGRPLRGIKMRGFHTQELNVLFVESAEPTYFVHGRETYWSAAGDFFLYRSEATNTWGAAKAKRFQQVREGTSNGVAHSPEGYEIWDAGDPQTKRGWREWSPEEAKWVQRPGSGVESRGKVRPKSNASAVAVQTEPMQVAHKAVQTDLSRPTSPPKSILRTSPTNSEAVARTMPDRDRPAFFPEAVQSDLSRPASPKSILRTSPTNSEAVARTMLDRDRPTFFTEDGPLPRPVES